MKNNSDFENMPAVVQHLAALVDGFDLASIGEMQGALNTIMPAKNISFAGPGKKLEDLRSAIAARITINLESEAELNRALVAADTLGIKPKVAIRVNPDFELKSSGMKMGGGPKQFGIDAEIIPDVMKKINAMNVEFMGFHIFSGSQNLNAEAIIEAQSKTIELAKRLSEHSETSIKKLNIGGGFGIPYFPGEKRLDLKPICDNLDILLNDVEKNLGDTKVIIELGRHIVGEAGIYVSKIIERKISRGEVFLISDGGLHHHLAASGNFGQIIRKNYPVAIGNKMNIDETEMASVVGPLCTPLDILADKMKLSKADTDDLIVVFQSGAYGYTASPHNFLSHPDCKEIFI